MRQTLRQIVAVLALVGLSMNLVPSALAATSYTDVSAANKLASSGFIVDKSATPAAYRLSDTLLRQEAVGTVGKVTGVVPNTPVASYTCKNLFSDTKEAWVCRAAELAREAGLVSSNPTFRPQDKLSRFEAVVFALRAADLLPSGSLTRADILDAGQKAGLYTSASAFNGDSLTTRGEFFRFVVIALDTADLPDICTLVPSFCDNVVVPPTGGAVSVSLNSATPAGYTVPTGANGLHVASYKITASTNTTLSGVTLKRVGLSVDADTNEFAVLVNGVRVTDAKDENSDDEVMLTFKNGGVSLSAGQTATVDVIMNVASLATTGAEVGVSLVAVSANGSVTGLPVTGNTFRVGSAAASVIEINSDGSVSAPSLGREAADLFRFKVKNNASNDNMTLRGITFKHTGTADENADLKNFKLMKGTETLATVASTNSQYVSFVLSNPLAISSGNTVSLRVVADVIGGAGETIAFEVNSELDVMASSARYGNAIDVNLASSTFGTITLKAGTITLIKINPVSTKIREDKDDQVLGSFTIAAAQTGLEAKKFGVVITTASTSADSATCAAGVDDSECYLENVQVRVKETGAVYDLTASAAVSAGAREYYDSSFDYSLIKGTQTFEIITDTANGIADFNTARFTLSLAADSAVNDLTYTGGLRIEETADDTLVTDITPASLSWNSVEGSESGLVASAVNTGSQSVVVGGDVSAVKFTLDSDESSSSKVDEVTVVAHSSAGLTGLTAANQVFTQAKLYKGSVASENLIATESSSDFAFDGTADTISVTFDGFMHTIAANTVETFVVVFSLVDDTNLSTTVATLDTVKVSAVSAEDVDGDDITVSGLLTADLGNTTIVGVGTLVAVNDVDNAKADYNRNVAGNSLSPYVAAYKLTATNEAVKIKDLSLTFTDASTDFTDSVNTVGLYDANDILVASKTVSGSDTLTFTGINYTAAEGNAYLYVKVTTNKIGKNAPGAQTAAAGMTVALSIVDAEGVSSGDAVSGLPIAATGTSNVFQVVPVRISAVSFASTFGGTTVSNSLSGTSDIVGILAITADTTTNTKAADGSSLKLEVDDVRLQLEVNSGVSAISSAKLIKIGGSDADGVTGTGTCTALCIFDTNTLTGEDELIASGTTSYYKLEVTSTFTGTATASIRPKLLLLDGGTTGTTAAIEYSSDDSATLISQTRLDFSSLNANAVTVDL